MSERRTDLWIRITEEHKDAGGAEADLLGAAEGDGDEEFAIVFAAMGVNMETAHFFKQVRAAAPLSQTLSVGRRRKP